jgi:hypothetical protein
MGLGYDDQDRVYVPLWHVVASAVLLVALLLTLLLVTWSRTQQAGASPPAVPVPRPTPTVFGPTPEPCLEALRLADVALAPSTTHADFLRDAQAFRDKRRDCVLPGAR